MSEVGTLIPHDSYKPLGLVVSNTHTHIPDTMIFSMITIKFQE